MSLKFRPVDVLEAPLPADAAVLHPERVILHLAIGYSFDVGAFCYAKRSAPVGARKGAGLSRAERRVDPATFDPGRVPAVRRLMEYISEELRVAARRPASAFMLARSFAAFIEWSETNGFADVLTSVPTTAPAFSAYVEHLRHRVNTGQVSVNTAAVAQNSALTVASELTCLDNLAQGVNLLRLRKSSTVATEPASEDDQARVLALCESLFDGLASLCLDFRPYPFALEVPSFLGARNNQLWTFPTRKWCMPPHEAAVRGEGRAGWWCYDYEHGRISEVSDVQHRYVKSAKMPRGGAETAISGARRVIELANADRQYFERRNAAKLAHNAFLVLFLSRTGMNWAGVQDLRWNDDFELGVERQGFRTVKYRAAGRIVAFEVQAGFMPRLRRFLQLRTYLLNGAGFDRLFMSGQHGVLRPEPLRSKTLTSIIESLRRLDPGIPDIKSKQWRASKSDWLLRTTDIATTAAVLQNSEATVIASYAAGSPTVHASEMSALFEGLESAVLDRRVAVGDAVPIAVGACTSRGHPSAPASAAVAPDCRAPEGCLFCDKYRLHADENDVRKLISCRYCIQQTAHMVTSQEHFDLLFGPILRRVESLLDEVEHREPGLVGRIALEVEEGELDPYWESKLEMLVDLEMVG